MKRFKGTPGPWHFNDYLASELKRYQVGTGKGRGVCEVNAVSDLGVAEANAHLIAAAPELLFALTELLIYALEYDLHGPTTELAQAIINKALGES